MIADLQQQLGIDSSFFWQFLIFLCVFLFLRTVYFSPYLKLIERRQGQSSGLSDEARKLEEESARLEAQYQESLSAVRKKAHAEREALLGGARADSTKIVSAAREKAKARVEQARESAAKSAETELSSLRAQVGSVSALLVEKLAQTKVGI
jgi:F-type H+-transporting ATPase subunit b